ncbi:MAG: LemA family protein [Nanoarchaeota archaeon]
MAKKSMNPMWIVLGVVLAIILFVGIFVAGSYNGFVAKDQEVERAWGNVQSAYQRRADLIPNLVDTVKGARDFEKNTLTEITKLRGEAVSASQKVQSATTTSQIQETGGEINSILSRLLVIVENYPDLKSNTNFLSLQDELAGTENRVKFERDNFNLAVRNYKTAVRSFPGVLIAGMFGFSAEKHSTFAAESGAENAPDVNFN